MKKILLLGDYENAGWHPLRGVDKEIGRILKGFDITATEDYPCLQLADMQAYDLVINYIDAWDKRAGPDFAGGLLAYVASGGALLTLHSGIIAHSLPEIEQLIGAAFTAHPPRETLAYVRAEDHPIMKEVCPFSINEEPYRFAIDNLAPVHVIMEYVYREEKFPAAWARGYGKGRSCYLSPGHDAAGFANEGFAGLLRRSALWCAGGL